MVHGSLTFDILQSIKDMILKIREPNTSELDSIQSGSTLISLVNPAQNQDLVDRLNQKKITTFALDQVPRVTIAQACDVLSSQESLSFELTIDWY